MKLTKKLLAIMLSLIMVFSMIVMPVSATEIITETPVVEEIVGEETTDEEAAEEESVGEFHEIFEAIRNLIEAIHNLVGGIMGNLGKECPFCGEVHEKDAEEPDVDGYYTVIFDFNYEGAPEAEKQKVKAGEYANVPADPENNGLQFMGWYINKNDTDFNNYYDFTEVVIADMTLYAKWLDVGDTDGEGLVDGLEEIYGTDKNLVDTDDDKISDYDEIVLGLNPLSADSDNNGIADGDEDLDLDGLAYLEEKSLNTEPSISDTDEDGLSDGDEVNIYKTNPTLYDTDDDAVNDGREVELGTDPNIAQEYFELSIESDTDEEDSVEPLLEIEAEGNLVDNISIDPLEEDFFFPEEMPGYMGKAYDFDVDGDFKTARIKFKFDKDSVDLENGDEPVIYYFDEENQTLEALDTTIDGDTAIAEVSHFSTYVLINRKIYEESFQWEDTWDSDSSYENVEIVFVVDDSGSMSWNDPSYERLSVARTLIDNLPEASKIGLVRFDGGYPKTEALTPVLTTDKEVVKNYLTRTYFYSPGGTDMYNGIQKAFPLYESTDETTLKMMIVLSDGETDDTYLHSSVISTANASNIRIYTVGLGNSTSYFNRYLKPLADSTDGAFYLASNAGELASIYKDISKKIDIETDSDYDGVPDYYEDNMVYFNGISIKTDKYNRDSDGDGLSDGEEIKIEKISHPTDNSKVIIKGKIIMGLPTKPDTDDDGYDDKDDFKPLQNYKTPIILIHGLNSNTQTAFGVKTNIYKDQNSHYGSNYSLNSKDYRDCRSHKIINISTGLGSYLTKTMKYKENKNLFAFNYPNQDMVQYNGKRLEGYIDSLISYAKYKTDLEVVDPQYLFASKSDMDAGRVKFMLIGHSMGGLVSRYLVENIGTQHILKVITMNTPHYGSGMATAGDATLNVINFCPSIYDLDTESTLFGGKEKTWDVTWKGNSDATQYALDNQSPALKGTHPSDVYYYAIGGYNVNHGVWPLGEIYQLAEPMRNTVFSFEFGRNTSSKKEFKNSINGTLRAISYQKYNEFSELDLGDDDGDNTVDYMSQFGVRFRTFKSDDSIEIRRTALVVDSKTISHRTDGKLGIGDKVFHNRILQEKELFKNVKNFVNAAV